MNNRLRMFNRIISSALSSVGLGAVPSSFKYELGKKTDTGLISVWDIHEGLSKADSSESVTIFVLNKKSCSSADLLRAQNTVQRLKTIRHPNVLKYLDSIETDSAILLATEKVIPLVDVQWTSSQPFVWGAFEILSATLFVLFDCKLFHGRLDPFAVFSTTSGSLKLSGFDSACPKDRANFSSIQPQTNWKNPPDSVVSKFQDPPAAFDVFGCLLILAYLLTDGMSRGINWRPTTDQYYEVLPPALGIRKFLESRSEPIGFLRALLTHPFFTENKSVQIMEFLNNFQLQPETEVVRALESLSGPTDLSDDMKKGPVLHSLMNIVRSSPKFAGSAVGPIVEIAELFRTCQSEKDAILSDLLFLYKIQDRSVRYKLLSGISRYSWAPVKWFETIFTEILPGFSDTHPAIREASLRAVPVLASIGSSKIGAKLMPHLRRCQADQEPPLRALAVAGVFEVIKKSGKSDMEISSNLIPTIVSGLQDPYPGSRFAASVSLSESADNISLADISGKIFPVLSPILLDPELGTASLDLMKRLLSRFEGSVSGPTDWKIMSRKSEIPTRPEIQSVPIDFPRPVSLQPTRPAATSADSRKSAPPAAGQTAKSLPSPLVKKIPDLDEDFWAELEKN